MKKVALKKDVLNEHIEFINDFLSKKGMSMIRGGGSGDEWGNTNYAESTYVRRVPITRPPLKPAK